MNCETPMLKHEGCKDECQQAVDYGVWPEHQCNPKCVRLEPIDTGDHVRHVPSGEEWVVAYVRNDRLVCCGWPESAAALSDCELVKKASAEDRKSLLEQMRDTRDSRGVYAQMRLAAEAPIDMVLYCPACGLKHIDAPDLCPECPGGQCMCVRQGEKWTNPPHRSHLCHGCGCIWRPADVPTNGVEAVKTQGKHDVAPRLRAEVAKQNAVMLECWAWLAR